MGDEIHTPDQLTPMAWPDRPDTPWILRAVHGTWASALAPPPVRQGVVEATAQLTPPDLRPASQNLGDPPSTKILASHLPSSI
jgi:hypothetical protein